MAVRSFHRPLVSAFIASILAFPLGCGTSSDDGGGGETPTENAPPPAGGETTPPVTTTPGETPSETPGATDPPGKPAPPPFDPLAQITSGEDITVDSVKIISPRTFDIFLTTPNISPKVMMSHGNAVRVTLPVDYATSGKHYPAIYYLHGASCNYTTVSQFMAPEKRAILDDVIVIQPEGGAYGFYTDWLDQSPPQKWETFHLTQLVPFLDRNLRTIAAKEGRGVIGFSMGGLGAMRYAYAHPELFAAATTLSGIVDLNHGAVQTGVVGMLVANKMDAAGPFGTIGISPVWGQKNPASHVAALATVKIAIYVGEGTDIAEATTASASAVLHHNMEEAKIPHYYENYGSPGETPEGTCNGGHTIDCARYATAKALPSLRAALANPH